MTISFDGSSVGAGLVLLVLIAAAVADLRWREVDDRLWLAFAIAGAILGGVAFVPTSALALGAWALAAGLVLEHLVPWDAVVERRYPSAPGWIEVGVYAGVGAVLAVLAISYRVGPTGVPPAAVAAILTVFLARGLFEVGLLWGGADAKALMTVGLVLPLSPGPWWGVPATSSAVATLLPFGWNVVLNGAILSVGVPIAVAVRNAVRGTFEFPRGFLRFPIPVAELPHRFVWLRDPFLDRTAEDAESAEDDQQLRTRQAAELAAKGETTVWVTPQVPFVVLLLGGAITALLAGNLLFDILGLL